MALPGYLRVESGALLLCVKVQPRSSVNEIGEPLGNELRVKVTAPPVDSAANEALIRFLAQKLDRPRGSVQLLRGQTARHKLIALSGITPEEVLAKLFPGSG